MRQPIDHAIAALRAGVELVRAVIVATRGSTPRDAGADCWIAVNDSWGSIGGGHLEYRAIDVARSMIAAGNAVTARREHVVLGATLGQCCGGVVDLWFERLSPTDLGWLEARARADVAVERGAIWTCVTGPRATRGVETADLPQAVRDAVEHTRDDGQFRRIDASSTHWFVEPVGARLTPLYLYGAGHVAHALVRILEPLPYAITWIDNRESLAIEPIVFSEQPEFDARHAPSSARHLVMTHDHDLDLRIVEAVLARGDFDFCGLIGSKTKAARFRHRLADRGFDAATIARLECPVGIDMVESKLPAGVAVAVAAQLLVLDSMQSRSAVPRSSQVRR